MVSNRAKTNVKAVIRLLEKLEADLAGEPLEVIGPAFVALVAKFVAAHDMDEREMMLEVHLTSVRRMIPEAVKMIEEVA